MNRQNQFLKSLLAAAVIGMASSSPTMGQFIVNGGVTSIFLDQQRWDNVFLTTVDSTSGTVAPVPTIDVPNDPPNLGYEIGLPISGSSDFQFETGPFNYVEGSIQHGGIINLTSALISGPLAFGNLSLEFDAGRIGAFASGYYIADNLALNIPLFDIASHIDISGTSTDLTIAGSGVWPSDPPVAFPNVMSLMRFSPEFVSGQSLPPILLGLDVGWIRTDATAIPEPSSSLFLLVGGLGLLLFRNNRKK
ncbi:MAG: PEP-CTERM sorting domain-containing protein [Verrucomicrobiota bacterium]